MKKAQVKLDKVYGVKVSGQVQPVRVERERPYGGWYGSNLQTGRQVNVPTAAKLRYEMRLEGDKWVPVLPEKVEERLTLSGRFRGETYPETPLGGGRIL